MAFRNLLLEDHGAVRRITINRPDKLNALNQETISELHIAFDQAAHDDAIRVVIMAGSGEKAFIAGADIAELATVTPQKAQEFSRNGQKLMTRIERLGKPVIARLQGFALGGGMELAMACHLRIASDKAKLGNRKSISGSFRDSAARSACCGWPDAAPRWSFACSAPRSTRRALSHSASSTGLCRRKSSTRKSTRSQASSPRARRTRSPASSMRC
jgi:hypothetical protein